MADSEKVAIAEHPETDQGETDVQKLSFHRRVINAFKDIKGIKDIQNWALLVALVAFLFDLGWRYSVERPQLNRERAAQAIEREEARFAREMQAWDRLSNKQFGHGGYGVAVEYLLSTKKLIDGLDMSCEAFGGEIKERRAEVINGQTFEVFKGQMCSTELRFNNWELSGNFDQHTDGTVLSELDASTKIYKFKAAGSEFERLSVRELIIVFSNFEKVNFINLNFVGVLDTLNNYRSSHFSNSVIDASVFNGADFSGSEFWFSSFTNNQIHDIKGLDSNFSGVEFREVDVSGTDFSKATDLPAKALSFGAWAWDDNPPIVKETVELPRLCPAKLRPDYELEVERRRTNFSDEIFHIPAGCKNWQWSDWPIKNLPKGIPVLSCNPASREDYYKFPNNERPEFPTGCLSDQVEVK